MACNVSYAMLGFSLMAFLFTLGSCLQNEGKNGLQMLSYSHPKRNSSWPHVCCNLLSLFFVYPSEKATGTKKKKQKTKKNRDKMIIFIAGISMEFSS